MNLEKIMIGDQMPSPEIGAKYLGRIPASLTQTKVATTATKQAKQQQLNMFLFR